MEWQRAELASQFCLPATFHPIFSKEAILKKDKFKVPSGTITIIIIFITVLVLLWGSAYFTMLSRGGVG